MIGNERSDHQFYNILSGNRSVRNLNPLKTYVKSRNLASVQALSYFDTKKIVQCTKNIKYMIKNNILSKNNCMSTKLNLNTYLLKLKAYKFTKISIYSSISNISILF